MTASLASRRNRFPQQLRGWAMTCAALACASTAMAQAAPAAPAPATAAQPAAVVLDMAQIDALLSTPDKVLFLDVRRADEISTIGGFPAYLNIQAGELDKFLAFIPRDRKIVTVSNHAARAKRAAAVLTSHGFQVAGAAGAQDYEAQGGRLTGQKPATPPGGA